MQELCGGDLEQSIRTVVNNLICSKDFKRAKEVCDRFSIKDNDNQIPKIHKNTKKWNKKCRNWRYCIKRAKYERN